MALGGSNSTFKRKDGQMTADVPKPIKGPMPNPPGRKPTNGRNREVYQADPDGILKSVEAGAEATAGAIDAQDGAVQPAEAIAAFRHRS